MTGIKASDVRAVAMRRWGHKAMSAFRRYEITSIDDVRDAARRLEA